MQALFEIANISTIEIGFLFRLPNIDCTPERERYKQIFLVLNELKQFINKEMKSENYHQQRNI